MASTLLRGTAFVTGAAKGIGQFSAYSLARHGIQRIAISDIDTKTLQDTATELKKINPKVEVASLHIDTGSEDSIVKGVEDTVKAFGSLDVAVNNAGIAGPVKPSEFVSLQDWKKVIDINLNGVWLCQREQIKQMLKQENRGTREGRGSIVNVASMYGWVGTPINVPSTGYVATKHAVMGITKADANVYAPQGIRINAMCPGYVATPLLKSSTDSGMMDPEIAKTPMGRMAQMEEIGDAIMFLCSPLSSFMSGAGLLADGGYCSN